MGSVHFRLGRVGRKSVDQFAREIEEIEQGRAFPMSDDLLASEYPLPRRRRYVVIPTHKPSPAQAWLDWKKAKAEYKAVQRPWRKLSEQEKAANKRKRLQRFQRFQEEELRRLKRRERGERLRRAYPWSLDYEADEQRLLEKLRQHGRNEREMAGNTQEPAGPVNAGA